MCHKYKKQLACEIGKALIWSHDMVVMKGML